MRISSAPGASAGHGMPESPSWYLFIHQLPPKPLYLRAKVRKLLSQAGALPLKDSVYVLPLRPDRLPALQEIAAVATGDGGDAFLWQGQFVRKARAQRPLQAVPGARGHEYSP